MSTVQNITDEIAGGIYNIAQSMHRKYQGLPVMELVRLQRLVMVEEIGEATAEWRRLTNRARSGGSARHFYLELADVAITDMVGIELYRGGIRAVLNRILPRERFGVSAPEVHWIDNMLINMAAVTPTFDNEWEGHVDTVYNIGGYHGVDMSNWIIEKLGRIKERGGL